MTRRLIALTLLGLLAGLLPFSLPAQVSGTLAGVILDPNREPLPRVTVRLLDTTGTEVARTLSDRHGRFAFENLVARQYTLTTSLVGFATITQEAVSGTHIELLLPLAPVREQIVVTATRTEAPTGQLGATHTVVSADEMRNRQVIPVHEAVRPVAGVAVVRSGGVGSTTSIFVRGGELDHNKVLLDGVVLNDPGGSFFFDNLTAENLERVEVVRGPQSALFGSDAMASVIQVFTRRGRSETLRPRFFLSGEGGNNDTWRTRAGVSGAAGRVDYSFQWARLSTDNREPNNVFHNASLSGNVGVALRRTTTLRFTLRGELGRVGTPGPTAFERADRDAFFRRRDAAFGVTLVDQTARWWEQRLLYSFTKSRQVSRNLVADPPFVPMFEGRSAPFAFFDFPLDFLNDNRRHRISYQSDWRAGGVGRRAGRHVVTFAFEWDREQGAFGDRLFGALPVEAQRDNLGWTFQHQALWGRLFLTNGVRVEDNNSFGVSLVPRSSLAFFLRQSSGAVGTTKLKFNFGLGIKEPTLVESFSPSPFFLGNAELAPERVRSFDLGVEQRFWWDRAKLEVNWFDNRFRDLIG
ncbi:MAG: TonB-dependent receptor plug domain-containing protein, partial [Terriglobia bacterium]